MKTTQVEIDIMTNEIMPLIEKILDLREELKFIPIYPDTKISYENELVLKSMEGLAREYRLLMKNYNLSRGDVIRVSNYLKTHGDKNE